ncbi:GPN-loop GTPase [Nematocida ausubeli]|nr:GPN-loop GTPase [Nematocida ausubeli]
MANTVLIVLGMAGSGKSTFCHRLHSWLSGSNPKINSKTGLNDKVCGINLDPAVNEVKMPVHYDIRNTIDIDELMQKKQLGPNGAILTALNLFAAHIDVLISQIEELQPEYTIIDTPGQIEMFTTSVSGQIITQCLSGTKGVQVKMVYVVDGEKAQHPQCFISNMLFATSIHYRFKEQLLVAVNKSDVEGAEKIKKWAGDFESFSEALPEEGINTPLTQSIALWMEEFYSNFNLFYISAATGLGKTAFIAEVNRKEEEPGKDETEEIISSTEHTESQDESDLPEAPASVIESIIETLKKTTILCDKPSADASISADEESIESEKEEKSSGEKADREEENHINPSQNTQKIE